MHYKKSIIPKIIILFLGLLAVIYIFFRPVKTEETSSNAVNSNTTEKQVENATQNEAAVEEQPVQNTVTEETPKDPIAEKLSQMTLEEKVGQLFIVRPDSLNSKTVLSDETKTLLEQYPVRWNSFI